MTLSFQKTGSRFKPAAIPDLLPPPEAKLGEPICTRAEDVLGKMVDLIIHGGYLGQQPTTVIDLTEDAPEVVREGVGDVQPFR